MPSKARTHFMEPAGTVTERLPDQEMLIVNASTGTGMVTSLIVIGYLVVVEQGFHQVPGGVASTVPIMARRNRIEHFIVTGILYLGY